ncbi:hypothetical protein Lal_00023805 [Lupinus albus]|nr:hypothetical protein Lal_00023805 [Lupinus albus]
MPPDFVVTSCALTWLMICVVFSNRISVLNDLAFLRIFITSWLPESDEGDCGNAGTNGFAGVGADIVGAGFDGAFLGAEAGKIDVKSNQLQKVMQVVETVS